MRKENDANILKYLFSVGAILLMTLSIIACAAAPIDYALTSKYYYEKGQYDETIKNAKQGIALNPNHAPSWFWLGVAYYNKGQYDEAIQPFQKVIELRPDDLLQSSYSFLGSTYLAKGNYDEAILNYNKALELNPNDISIMVSLGTSYYQKRNYDESILYYNKALKLNPNDINATGSRGWSFYLKGDFTAAIRDFNKTIENLKPEQKNTLQYVMRGKAFSYLGLGDGETAINLVKQAKSALDYNSNYDLSLIYYVMGNKEKARELRGGKGAVGLEVSDYKKGEIKGANVVRTVPGGPAEKSGIMAGDVIIKINNGQVLSGDDLVRMVAVLKPGTTAKIKVLREGMDESGLEYFWKAWP